MIEVFIAEDEDIIREGLKALVSSLDGITVCGDAKSSGELSSKLANINPDVLIIDYNSEAFSVLDLGLVQTISKSTKIIAVTELTNKETIHAALRTGINGHILKCCDKQEINDAITAVVKNEKFYCGKVLSLINDNDDDATCAPVGLSIREIEVIAEIADGQTNKEIADKLCLSTHTVNTHRKNIMAKLGINNTAGIVIYAVKERIISPNKYLFSASTSN